MEEIKNLEKRVYTPQEVKKILGIGTNAVYELMKSKTFPSRKIGNKWIVPIKPFNVWLDTQEVAEYEEY